MNLSPRHSILLEALAVFCSGVILFSMGLSQQEIIGFESRFYLFAQEMWRHGPTWFPTTYDVAYADYPVTSTLMIYLCAKILGGLSKFSAVLPSAIAASVTLAVTYMIGALHQRSWGLFAVFFMLLTNAFLVEARTISPDQYVAMVTTLSFYLTYSASLSLHTKRLWFIPFLFAVGFAFRGPIGLVLPAGVICIFYLLDKNFKLFFLMGLAALLTLLICSMFLLGIAYHVGGMAFVQDVLRMQVLGRLLDATLPWYFYFTESLGAYVLSYPVAILVTLGLLRTFLTYKMNQQQKLILKLLGWSLIVLIGLSIPAGKKIRYLLAFVPALALISAYVFAYPSRQGYNMVLRKTLYIFFWFSPLLCFMTMAEIEKVDTQKHFTLIIPFLPLLIGLGILQMLAWFFRKKDLVVIGIATCTLLMIFIFVLEPVNLMLNRTRDFVLRVEAYRKLHHQALAFYREDKDGKPIKYLVNMPTYEKPLFITSGYGLADFHTSAVIIVGLDHVNELPSNEFETIDQGNIGRDSFFVLQRKHQ